MQDCVPYHFSGKSKIMLKKRIFAITLIALAIIGVASAVLAITLKHKSESYLKTNSFYFVYADKNAKKEILETKSESVKNLGGAGKIISVNGQYYLTVNVYFDKKSAEEIKENIADKFVNAGVLEVSKSLSKNLKRQITRSENANLGFKKINELLNDVHSLMLSNIAGNINESMLITELMRFKLELEELAKDTFESDSEFDKKIASYENLFILCIDRFLDDYFITTKKQALSAELSVSVSNYICELYDNL